MRTITLKAPVKINLFLEVTGKRPDGYHELDTIFAKLDFGDTVRISLSSRKGPVTLRIDNRIGAELSAGADNLAVRAAELVRGLYGVQNAVSIRLTKRIPVGAGLGGGSSDAGAVIRGLCRLLERDPLAKPVRTLAAKLGADVPVFLYENGLMRGRGIGERLVPLPMAGRKPYAAVFYPGVPQPTGPVFKALRLPSGRGLTTTPSLNKLKLALKKGLGPAVWGKFLFNRLEAAVVPMNAGVRLLKTELSANADFVLMSGSGSSVFCLCEDRRKALQLVRLHGEVPRSAFAARFL